MRLIDTFLLDTITSRAQESPRLRMNYNFHDSLAAPSQRLINAVEPGTIMPIHRHLHTSETYVVLRGRIKVVIYSSNRMPLMSSIIDPSKGIYGGHIDKGEWHTIEVLDRGSIIFECKDGPYIPVSESCILK